jgi:hypothetical protein
LNTYVFSLQAGGVTALVIGGTTPAVDYSQFSGANVELAGALNVSSVGGYTPRVGDRFFLLTYSSTRTGDFSPVNVQAISGIFWKLLYKDQSLHLWATTRLYIPLAVYSTVSQQLPLSLPQVSAQQSTPRTGSSRLSSR